MRGDHADAFDEGRVSAKTDPLYDPHASFPYDEIDQRLTAEKPDSEAEKLADVLREMLAWLIEGNRDHRSYSRFVFHKTLAMVWVLRPELLGSPSLQQLGNQLGVGSRKGTLSTQAVAFSDRFGIVNRSMQSQAARAAFRQSAADRHAARLEGDSRPRKAKGASSPAKGAAKAGRPLPSRLARHGA